MRLAPPLLIAVFLAGCAAPPPLAQDPLPAPPPAAAEGGVMLSGWGLPEGSAVTTATYALRTARVLTRPADAAEGAPPLRTLEVFSAFTDSVRVVVLEAGPEGLRRAEEHILVSDVLEDVHEGGEVLERGRRTNPLSGQRIALERTEGGGWHRALVGAEASEAQRAALDAMPVPADPEYPARPVTVGETWEVDRATLAALYGALAADAPQRMTLRLDSLGTYLGRPAAFLAVGLDLTLEDAGGRTRLHEVGVVARALDLHLDLYAERQGTFRTEETGAPATDAEGRPVRSVMEGQTRTLVQRFVTVPAVSEAP